MPSLATTERRYVAAVELTRELVVGVDAGCVIRLFNAGAEAATGYGREEVIGKPFASLLARESHEAFAKAFDERPATGRLSIETVVRTRAGHARHVRWEIVSAKADDDLDTFLTGHDATDERALAERTRQSEKLAAVGTLAAGLAHEIRNPLNGAQLHLSYLARTLGKAEAPADTLEAVGVIGDEIKRLASLVTEFLDFARPKPLTRRTVGLVGVCERTLALGGAHGEGVTLVRDFPPKDIMVDADAAKLEQVLLNVVNNAVEALAPSGGGSAPAQPGDGGPSRGDGEARRQRAVAREPRADLRRLLLDQGARYGSRSRDRPSHRHRSRRHHRGGEPTRAHGVSHHVAPQHGGGSRTTDNSRTRILVVDDEPSARGGPRSSSRRIGFIVDTAADGAAAVAIAVDKPPDIVVTDLKMPNMDGIEPDSKGCTRATRTCP